MQSGPRACTTLWLCAVGVSAEAADTHFMDWLVGAVSGGTLDEPWGAG